MNTGQIIYLLALAALFAWRGPSWPAWVLLGNAMATLGAALAMDLGALQRSDATLTMMVIDFVALAALMAKPGLSRLLSIAYALTVPIYAANILFSLSDDTTFALVMSIGFVQIAVAGIGAGDGDGGGGRYRRAYLLGLGVALQCGTGVSGKGGVAAGRDNVSPDRRGT